MTADELTFLLLNLPKKLVWIKIFVLDLDLVPQRFFFLFIDVERLSRYKKTKHISKEEIKKRLLDSMIIDENLEFDDLNKEAEEVQDREKAAKIIKWQEGIIKTKRKGIINVANHEGQVFKRFKEKEKFSKLVSDLVIRNHHF